MEVTAGGGEPAGEHPSGEPVGEPVAAERLRVIARGGLERSRATVAFRLLLALPHLVILAAWSILMVLVAIINWFAVLITAQPIGSTLIGRYLRYYTHVGGYLALAADPYPGFPGDRAAYPVDLELPQPQPQRRWKAALRPVLAIPALLLGFTFGSLGISFVSSDATTESGLWLGIVATAAVLGWFASLAQGRMAQGLRDLIVFGIGYMAQLAAYLLLLTDTYPDSDPRAPGYPQPAPEHPVRILVDDDGRRSRLTVFFRLLLWLPHLVWLTLWGFVAALAVIANWFVMLFAGRPSAGLHRFVAAYVRYTTHAMAFLYLIANPFPGFVGEPGSYPIELQIPPPEPQSRWITGFRLVLALPALILASAVSNLLVLVAIFGWFTGLILGRMPIGLRNLGAYSLRYSAQSWAYLGLLTDRYPFAGPSLELLPEASPPQPAS